MSLRSFFSLRSDVLCRGSGIDPSPRQSVSSPNPIPGNFTKVKTFLFHILFSFPVFTFMFKLIIMNFAVTVTNSWCNLLSASTIKVYPGLPSRYSLFFFDIDKKNNYKYKSRMYFDTAEEMSEFLDTYIKKYPK